MSVRGTHVTEQLRSPVARVTLLPAENGQRLVMQGRSGRMLPKPEAIMKIAANKDREQIGMDVPKRLRELREPERGKCFKEAENSMPLSWGVGA